MLNKNTILEINLITCYFISILYSKYEIGCIKLLAKIHMREDNARKAQAINPMGVIWLCKKCVSTASLLINDIDYEFPNVLHLKMMAK